MNGPCVKQRVIATIVTATGERFVGENDCDTPQMTCPRADMPTGVGYELCRSVCHQTGHAEVNALRKAGTHAAGGRMFIEGHFYACDPCKEAMASAGVVSIEFCPPPAKSAA